MSDVGPASSIGTQATAVVLGTFLSGTMTGLALIMVPVLLNVNTDPGHMLRQWVCLYNYGHRVLPAISIATLLVYGVVVRSKLSAGEPWGRYAAAGALTVGIIPFTFIVMLSTNNLLFRLEEDLRGNPKATTFDEAKRQVTKWSRMHLVRSMLPLAGAVLGLSALLKELKGREVGSRL